MYAKLLLRICLILLISGGLGLSAFSQADPLQSNSLDLFSDSTLFIGGSSLTLLRKNAVEINILSSLSSFQVGTFESRENSPYRDIQRVTEFRSRIDSYLGMSKDGRFDLGLRVEYKMRRFDNKAQASVFDVFQANQNPNNYGPNSNIIELDDSFGGVTHLGIRARIKPFAENQKFTIFGGYSFGVVKSTRFQRNLQAARDRLDLNIAYYTPLNTQVYYFFNINALTDIANQVDSIGNYQLGANFALIHMSLNRRLTIYPGLNYSINAEPSSERSGKSGLAWTSQQLAGFLGAQAQLGNNFLLNASYTLPINSRFASPWFEIVPRSFTSFSLGLRYLL